jgi:phospholipid/cholesterol/gamma-HCH transport system substrate-binding protein
MHRHTLETIMGAIVLLAAASFVMLAYEVADMKGNGGYLIAAEFGSTGGLSIGDDVRISGIKVGQITAQQLDPITFVAKISMAIDPAIKIPSDSSARITQASLLGGNYLELMPGAATKTLVAGEVIYDTRDPVSLNDLLGKAIFSAESGTSSSVAAPAN